MKTIKGTIVLTIVMIIVCSTSWFLISYLKHSSFNYFLCAFCIFGFLFAGAIRIYLLNKNNILKIHHSIPKQPKKFKAKIEAILIAIGIILFIFSSSHDKYHLNQITFIILYMVGLYMTVFSNGIYIGKIDVTSSRAINILIGIIIFGISIYSLFSPVSH